MPALSLKSDLNFQNPLDLAEMALMEREWDFDRTDDNEIVAQIAGMWGPYRVWCSWNEDCGALMICCAFEQTLPRNVWPKVYALLATVNERLWIGHFDLSTDDASVTFRHSLLSCDGTGVTSDQVRHVLDLAVKECERFYPALQAVVWAGKPPIEALEMSLFETVAEA